jgi:hypothetical protein
MEWTRCARRSSSGGNVHPDRSRCGGEVRRWSRRARQVIAMVVFAMVAGTALSGPVEVYREGERWCPRNIPPTAPRIDVKEAERIALRLVPDDFCTPRGLVGGCDVEPEFFYDSWRMYVHQYRRVPGKRDWAQLTHTYVILDAVGNCVANIPGTEPGAPR